MAIMIEVLSWHGRVALDYACTSYTPSSPLIHTTEKTEFCAPSSSLF